MDTASSNVSDGPARPEFGENVLHGPQPCTSRELFQGLVHLEENVHYLEPAFAFVEPSWARRVAAEFAASGLTDGSWLRGTLMANAIEDPVGMLLLQQFMIRFGDPGSREARVERYRALLSSLGIKSDAVLAAGG